MTTREDRFQAMVDVPSKADADAAKEISRAVNTMLGNPSVVGHLLAQDHRTLQQGFMSIVVGFIEAMAENDANGWTDARNEHSAAFASTVKSRCGDHLAFEFKTSHRFPFI